MTLIQAVVLGIIQGLTEFLPISSSAHLVLVPWIFRWNYQGLTYDIALHWGTLAAVAVYFWRDWKALARRGLFEKDSAERRILLGLVLATVPAAVAGIFLEDAAENFFRGPNTIAWTLMVFALVLAASERWGSKKRVFEALTLRDMVLIGIAQALALVPGVSRSGITITAALALGLKRDAAARFSFLLATPVILGAGLLKLRSLDVSQLTVPFWAGVAASALTGLAAIWLLMAYAKRRDFSIFVAYRIGLGLLILTLAASSPEGPKAKLRAAMEGRKSAALEAVEADKSGPEKKEMKKTGMISPPSLSLSLRERLKGHVYTLAANGKDALIGERNLYEPAALERARDYVVSIFKQAGYQPELQAYPMKDYPGIPDGTTAHNVIAVLPGIKPASEGIYVIGAHYDSAPGTPGADDNASGTAVLLELARILKNSKPSYEIRFVAFSTEEPPAFATENVGSRHYAKALKSSGQRVLGMWSLETIGHYSDEPGSQLYPPILSWFYPDTGDFIGLVANLGSRKFLNRCRAAWKKQPDAFPLVSAALPPIVRAITMSDHWSFIQEGYPAIMVTDTAFFRNIHYHEPTDTPEKLNYEKMAALTQTLAGVLFELAE